MEEFIPPKATVVERGAIKPKNTLVRRLAKKLNPKRLLIIVLVVVAMVFGVLKLNHVLLVRGGCAGEPSSPVYTKAATLMTPSKLNDLKQYTDEIVKKRGYVNDPNCIYPVLYYHLSVGDVPGATTEYEKLKKVYKNKTMLSVAYKNSARSLNDVTMQMERLKKTQEEIFRNRTFSE